MSQSNPASVIRFLHVIENLKVIYLNPSYIPKLTSFYSNCREPKELVG